MPWLRYNVFKIPSKIFATTFETSTSQRGHENLYGTSYPGRNKDSTGTYTTWVSCEGRRESSKALCALVRNPIWVLVHLEQWRRDQGHSMAHFDYRHFRCNTVSFPMSSPRPRDWPKQSNYRILIRLFRSLTRINLRSTLDREESVGCGPDCLK